MPQTSVPIFMPNGVIGDFYDNTPRKVDSYTINTPNPLSNLFGRAFTFTGNPSDDGTQTVQAGGLNDFAGIMVSPKEHPLLGVSGNPLANTLILPNGVQAAFCTMGRIYATVLNVNSEGDWVVFDNTTGALSAITKNTTPPLGTTYAKAFISKYEPSAGNLCVIEINKYQS